MRVRPQRGVGHRGATVSRTRIVLVLLMLLAAAALLAQPIRRFLAQDSCLDSGQRWNVATEECEHEGPR